VSLLRMRPRSRTLTVRTRKTDAATVRASDRGSAG